MAEDAKKNENKKYTPNIEPRTFHIIRH